MCGFKQSKNEQTNIGIIHSRIHFGSCEYCANGCWVLTWLFLKGGTTPKAVQISKTCQILDFSLMWKYAVLEIASLLTFYK